MSVQLSLQDAGGEQDPAYIFCNNLRRLLSDMNAPQHKVWEAIQFLNGPKCDPMPEDLRAGIRFFTIMYNDINRVTSYASLKALIKLYYVDRVRDPLIMSRYKIVQALANACVFRIWRLALNLDPMNTKPDMDAPLTEETAGYSDKLVRTILKTFIPEGMTLEEYINSVDPTRKASASASASASATAIANMVPVTVASQTHRAPPSSPPSPSVQTHVQIPELAQIAVAPIQTQAQIAIRQPPVETPVETPVQPQAPVQTGVSKIPKPKIKVVIKAKKQL